MIPLSADAMLGEDDDGDPFILTPRVRLDADHACFRRLGWRLTLLDRALDPLRAAPALVAAGYADLSRAVPLLELRHPRGHRVVLVPRTGRVQIRLDVETPPADRVAVAAALGEEIARAAGGG